ncbi:MAG: hypothetical protein IBJ18_02750 [Phycisphaerales bacterium]|nr:hypothetical protein [Phycisphaerales bacterium]
MNTALSVGLVLSISSIALVGYSGWNMAHRVRTFNEANPPAQWHFERSYARDSFAHGRAVNIADVIDPASASATTEDNKPVPVNTVQITYAASPVDSATAVTKDKRTTLSIAPNAQPFPGASVLLRVNPPAVNAFKDLSVYEEWLAPLAFAPLKDGKLDPGASTGKGVRYAVVNRRGAEGYDAQTWGAVRVKDWTFDIIEFNPDGSLSARVVQFPDRRGRLPAEVYAREDLAKQGKPVPELPPVGPRLTQVEMLQERSWEWGAALFAVPKSQVSRYRYKVDAVDGTDDTPGMGWTLPAAGVGVLTLTLGVGLMLSSTVRRR